MHIRISNYIHKWPQFIEARLRVNFELRNRLHEINKFSITLQ